MTVHLPADGFRILQNFLVDPLGWAILSVVVLIVLKASYEWEYLWPPVKKSSKYLTKGFFGPLWIVPCAWIFQDLAFSYYGLSSEFYLDLFLRNSAIIVLVYIYFGFFTQTRNTFRYLTGRLRPPGKLLLLGVIVYFGTGFGIWGITGLYPVEVSLPAMPLNSYSNVIELMMAILLIPVTEEIIFRGVLYPNLRSKIGVFLSVIGISAVFTVSHGLAGPWPYMLLASIVLTLLYEVSYSIIPCIVVHTGFNGILIFAARWL